LKEQVLIIRGRMNFH